MLTEGNRNIIMDNSLGEIIRTIRKEKKITQEELADGICSTVSLSKIENGVQMPSSQTLEKILDKLGTSTYQICNIFYRNEKQRRFEEKASIAASKLSAGDIEGAKELEKELVSFGSDDSFSRQIIAFIQGIIALYEKPEDSIKLLTDAFKITKPSFDFDEFRDVLLTSTEANILSIITVAYHKNGNTVYAIKICEELLQSMKKHKSMLKAYELIQINTAMNLSQYMSSENRCAEALEYITFAEKTSIEKSQESLLPEIEFLKAGLLNKMGRRDESRNIVQAIVPYMELIKKEQFATRVKEFAKKEFGISFG